MTMLHFLSPKGLRQWRNYFELRAIKPKPQDWPAWFRIRDALPYESDLHPWLDGFCRIPIPDYITKSGVPEEWVFTPDLLEIYHNVNLDSLPKTNQEAIDRVYNMAGTAD